MKKYLLTAITSLVIGLSAYGQTGLVKVKTKTYKTGNKGIEVKGEEGFMQVYERRENPDARIIKFKYVRLKSLSDNPKPPLVFLEGGGGSSTWQAESPAALADWIELLQISDLIFVDRRGTDDKSLTYIWREDFPKDFFVSEKGAELHYKKLVEASLKTFERKNIDVTGYNIEEQAYDIKELMIALNIDRYSIFGFSFGSHIGMTAMKLFPNQIEKAILAGSDAPNQAFNYPRYLDTQVDRLAEMVQADSALSKTIPNFKELVDRVMKKLKENPAVVTLKNPITRKKMDVQIGSFGLALILRLDIDDFNDISALPRLIYSIDQGDYRMLSWFAQKRMVFALAISGNGINQQLASGVSPTRLATIKKEADESIFGNVVNFPFSAARDYWVANKLTFDASIPLQTDIPTLFITGGLDCRTPVEQVKETMRGFSNALHVEVENAGHEQAMWEKETFDGIIPDFLLGKKIANTNPYYSEVEFIPLEGKTKKHPSVR